MVRSRFNTALLLASTLLAPTPTPLQAQQPTLPPALLAAYSWRNLGPDRGGRSIATSGVTGRPLEAYFGATGGGLWKTTDGGDNWHPVTDFQITSSSIGAVAVAETDPDLVFIGTGETCIRGNILPGDGVYRSRDAGATWEHIGFRDSHGISKIRIHPTDPAIVYVASFGKYGVPSEERGVFRSTDGGDIWERILFRDERTGAIDIVIDRNNPDVLYASLWEAFRKEYTMSSGGPGSGMFKSTDGGDSWTEITRNPGMPAEGVVGRIGVAVSSANSNPVYSLFEHADGGLFRSDDGGETLHPAEEIRPAFERRCIRAGPLRSALLLGRIAVLFPSRPALPARRLTGLGARADSFTDCEWTDQKFSTAQFYHGVTTAHIPWHICGSQQDNSTLCLPSDWNAGRFASALADTADDSGARAPAITRGSIERVLSGRGRRAGLHRARPQEPRRLFLGHQQRPLPGPVQPPPGHLARGRSEAARGQDPRSIRAAMHSCWTASLCVAPRANSAAIPLSSRLASPAPRRSRCSRGLVHGLLPLVLLRRAGHRHGRALAVDLSNHFLAHRSECPVHVVQPALADHRRLRQLGAPERRPDPRGPHDARPFGRPDHRRHERAGGVRDDLRGRARQGGHRRDLERGRTTGSCT